jgi:hypothetical protein
MERLTMPNCGECKFYDPLKGEPAAGWCLFVEHRTLPFWMDANLDSMKTLRALKGSDVLPTDGAECDAFQPEKSLEPHLPTPYMSRT